MSKGVRRIVGFAAPIIGSFFGGPLGGAVGGALGGAISGGGLKGAALGGITGYMSSGLVSKIGSGIMGSAAHLLPAGVSGPVTAGSGIMGAITGGGLKALSNTVSQGLGALGTGAAGAATTDLVDPLKQGLLGLGNQAITVSSADAAEEAAKKQQAAVAPYTQMGADAAAQIKKIQADPGAYVANNPFYKGLADEAQNRLLANQAAKGKVGSGGTADALQTSLLNLGNGLVQDQVRTLQGQAAQGQEAAGYAGNAAAAGTVGAQNAYNSGYQNQLNTILALQGNRTPTYQPNSISI